jgi:hypothetical protein
MADSRDPHGQRKRLPFYLLYQTRRPWTHAAGVLPGTSIAKTYGGQWDIGAALRADDGRR